MSQNRASMLDRPVAQTFFRYGLPWSAAFLLLSSAGLVDTIFIGRYVGAQALAAVNIISPVFSIFFGMGVMLSVGGTVRSAHHVGRGGLWPHHAAHPAGRSGTGPALAAVPAAAAGLAGGGR